jgi:hypothetical protein
MRLRRPVICSVHAGERNRGFADSPLEQRRFELLGALPLAIGFGNEGAELRRPLGISICRPKMSQCINMLTRHNNSPFCVCNITSV